MKLQPKSIAPEEMETAGDNKITIKEWVPRVHLTIHTIKDKFIKSFDLGIMPMQQLDILLGRDSILNTLAIQSDLSITTRKGELIQQWSKG